MSLDSKLKTQKLTNTIKKYILFFFYHDLSIHPSSDYASHIFNSLVRLNSTFSSRWLYADSSRDVWLIVCLCLQILGFAEFISFAVCPGPEAQCAALRWTQTVLPGSPAASLSSPRDSTHPPPPRCPAAGWCPFPKQTHVLQIAAQKYNTSQAMKITGTTCSCGTRLC